MRRAVALAVVALVAAPLSGCQVVDGWFTRGETQEVDGERFLLNGVANDPTAPKVEAGRIDTPLGEVLLEGYPSAVGPCVDVVYPDGRREPSCLVGSGIEPDRPVTGRPGDSIEGINAGSWNVELSEPGRGIGTLHAGLAHPSIVTVTVRTPDGAETDFEVVQAPNVAGLAAFVAWTDEGVRDHELAAYDAEGCLVDLDTHPHDDGPGADPPAC